jgi:hypothetical protein
VQIGSFSSGRLQWAALFFCLPAFAQAPTSPKFFLYYQIPPATTWQYQAITIDPPLQLVSGPDGAMHLRLDPAFVCASVVDPGCPQ